MRNTQPLSPLARSADALLRDNDVVPSRSLLLCGLSGGADSVALVLVLKELGYDLVALHCNFHLRGDESDADEAFVRRFCQAHAVPLRIKHFDTRAEAAAHGESIEMAARRLRYEWFRAVKDELSDRSADSRDAYVCVAHHADDNVETFLLNLIRGAGLRGLSGMRVVNHQGVVRPLLEVSRTDIEAYLRERGESFAVDSTNADTRYRRNKVRHELLPLLRTMNPSVERTLRHTMFCMRQADDLLLSAQGDEHYHLLRKLMDQGFSKTQAEQMQSAREGTFVITTHHPHCPGAEVMLTRHRGKLIVGPVPRHIAPTPLLNPTTPLEGVVPSFDFPALLLTARRMPVDAVVTLRDKQQGVFDVAQLRGPLIVRSVEPGDRFRPFGLRGTKLVSDYLTDRHRSRLDKLAALVLCDDEGILWLLGETIDQRAAVTAKTTEVLVVRMDTTLSPSAASSDAEVPC